MTIVETHKGYEISFQFDRGKIQEIKQIPGAWFNGASKTWNLPKRSSSDVDRLRKKYGLVDEELTRMREDLLVFPGRKHYRPVLL